MRHLSKIFHDRIGIIFAVFAVGSIAAALYLLSTGIRFDYNIEAFLPDEDPSIKEYRDFSERYNPDDAIVMIGFETDRLFSEPVLDALAEITALLEQIPHVDRVNSLANLEHIVIRGDVIERRRLIESGDDPVDVRTRALADSSVVGYFVDPLGSVTALYVHINPDEKGYAIRSTVIDGILGVTAQYKDQFHFRYSGIPYLRNTYVDAVSGEALRYFLLSSLVILAALVWLFRGLRGVVVPLLIVYLGVVWTVAIMMVTGSAIDVLSSTISAMILVVGVADSVHLLTRYYDGIAAGLGKREAVRDMLVRLGTATFLTSITTALGFATLMTSNIVPVRRFGVYTAVGVVMTFVVSIILLTAVLTWMPKPRTQSSQRLSGPFRSLMEHIDRITSTYSSRILLVGLAMLLVSVIGATKVRVNAFINDDLGPGTTLYHDQAFFQENLVSPFPLEIVLTGEADAFHDPMNLEGIEHLQTFLRSRPSIGRSYSIVDVIKELDKSLNPDATGSIPESSDLVSQYLFLLDLADSESARQFISPNHAEARIASLVDDIGSVRLEPLLAEIDSVVAGTFDANLAYTKTGTIVLASRVSDHIVDSLLVSTALAFLFVSVLMGFLYRSPALVLISLIPNVMPLIVVAGFMGFAGIELKPATAVIFSISFGIAVDDTIHLLARLRQELALKHPLRQAIRNALLGTGKAIVITSIILTGGFLVLLTSQFQSSVYMGGLIALAVLLALLSDIFLLPALLYSWSRICETRGRDPFR